MAQLSKRKRDERRFGKPERLADKVSEATWFPPAPLLSSSDPDESQWMPARRNWAARVRWLGEGISKSTVIVADNVAEFVFSNEDQEFSWEDIPPLAPPSQRFLVEFKRPDDKAIRHQFVPSDGSYPEGWGVLFASLSPEQAFPKFDPVLKQCQVSSEEVESVLWCHILTDRDGGLVGPIAEYYVLLGNQGEILASPCTQILWSDYYDSEERVIGMRFYLQTLFHPALLSLSFMNCKNVSLGVVEPNSRLNRERRKAGLKPFLRYHTINIEPMKTVLRTEGNIETEGLKRALHICRGHFATYSEERPLFGRKAGTFWIPAHVRGSAKQGVVVSDYSVSPPKPKGQES